MTKDTFIPYMPLGYSTQQTVDNSQVYLNEMLKRRSVREFSDKSVPKEVIENIIMTAGSAPSGAHKQPWVFCAISSQEIKSNIREAAEKEEYLNYHGRMSPEWMDDLKKFGTNWEKSFLEIAPWLIVIFKKSYDLEGEGKKKNYYVNESVGIATGFLISAIQNAGLVTLTHTPSPMKFLHNILDRPSNEKAYLLLPVGYPKENTTVPLLTRKDKSDIIKFY